MNGYEIALIGILLGSIAVLGTTIFAYYQKKKYFYEIDLFIAKVENELLDSIREIGVGNLPQTPAGKTLYSLLSEKELNNLLGKEQARFNPLVSRKSLRDFVNSARQNLLVLLKALSNIFAGVTIEPLPMAKVASLSESLSSKEWLTRGLLKELDFDACDPRYIKDTMNEIGASPRFNSTHDEMLDFIVESINNTDVTGMLLFANRVWFFESKKFRTKQWHTFTKLIYRTYGKDKSFRTMVKNRTHLSADFPIDDLL